MVDDPRDLDVRLPETPLQVLQMEQKRLVRERDELRAEIDHRLRKQREGANRRPENGKN